MNKTFSFIPRVLSKNVRSEKTHASVTQLITPDSRDVSGLETKPDVEKNSPPLTVNIPDPSRDTSPDDSSVLKQASGISNCDISDIDPSIIAFSKSVSSQSSNSVPSSSSLTHSLPHGQVTQQSADKNNHFLSLNQNPFTCSLIEALNRQMNPPFVDVGALSQKRKVPFYQRQTSPLAAGSVHSVAQDVCLSMPMVYGPTSVPARTYSHSPRGPAAKKFRKEDVENKPDFKRYRRSWEFTQCGRQYLRHRDEDRGFDFTVMSYNVLAQKLIEDNIYLYNHCKKHTLEWRTRKRLLLAEIKHHKPDVICLQEVQEDHYQDFFKPQLRSLGYGGTYVQRTGDKPDGCATFYNKSRFTLDQSVPVKYFVRRDSPVLDRDNVALIVKLRPISQRVPSKRRLCVANTHLLYNPRRGDVKLAQIMMLLAELDKHAYSDDCSPDLYHSMIVCGDFNSQPNSEINKLMTMGFLPYDGLLLRTISGQQEGLERGRDVYLHRDFFPRNIGISDTCQYTREVAERARSSQQQEPAQEDVIVIAGGEESQEDDCIVLEDGELPPSSVGGGKPQKPMDCIVIDDEDEVVIDKVVDSEKSSSTIPKHSVTQHDLHVGTHLQRHGKRLVEGQSSTKRQSDSQRQSGSESIQELIHGSGTLTHEMKFVSSYPQAVSHIRYEDREISTAHSKTTCKVDYIFYGVSNCEVRFRHGEVQMRDLVEGNLHLLGRYRLLSSRDIWKMGGLPNKNLGSDHLSLMARFLLK